MEKGRYNGLFSIRLRELLDATNTTQLELANYCGVKRQSISLWKKGSTCPDIQSLIKVAEFFNVSADYLLGLTDVSSNDLSVRDISEKTGISEKNVELLVQANMQHFPGGDFVNDILDIFYDEERADTPSREDLVTDFMLLTKTTIPSKIKDIGTPEGLKNYIYYSKRINEAGEVAIPYEDFIKFYAGQISDKIKDGLIRKYYFQRKDESHGQH